MIDPLSPVEVRVLGSLVEKSLATPEYYPMTLNALVNACNQKTGREPVMELSVDDVATALDQLMRRRLAGTSSGAGARVEKYRHALDHALELDTAELAALAVLLLRGPQTAGEVRSRTGRMFEFETLTEAEAVLERLSSRDEPLVQRLPVQPGRKEPRYSHLLGGPVAVDEEAPGTPAAAAPIAAARERGDRLDALEERVASLEEGLQALRETFDEFRRQFE